MSAIFIIAAAGKITQNTTKFSSYILLIELL